jgi:NADH-quinone oxidoreductase subunit N
MLSDLLRLAPFHLVVLTALVALMMSVVRVRGSRAFIGRFTAIGFALAGAVLFMQYGQVGSLEHPSMSSTLVLGPATHFTWALLLVIGFCVALMSSDHLPAQRMDHGEFYALTAFAVSGMMIMVAASEFFTFFIGLEIMSMAVYVLCGFKRSSVFSAEASLKYFILGSFASAILLLGIAFAYGATGSTSIVELGHVMSANGSPNPYGTISLILITAGFAFKVAAFPFQAWTPDAYEGAPTPVTALMAAGVKTAAVVGFLRIFVTAFGSAHVLAAVFDWTHVLAVLACATIIFGNLAALGQNNVKRMLAYSAIAHAGYLLIAVSALGTSQAVGDGQTAQDLGSSIFYYLLVYGVANLAAFGVLSLFGARNREDIDHVVLSGAARKHPVLSLVLALALLSLAGIPPLAGFFGKFYLLREIMAADSELLWLVIVAVLGSAVSAYYYLRPIVRMYMYAEYEPIRVIRSGATHVALALCVIVMVHAGIRPAKYVELSMEAAQDLSLEQSQVHIGQIEEGLEPEVVERKSFAQRSNR